MPRYMSYEYGWSVEYGFGSRDMETGSLWMFLMSHLLFFGHRPGTNGVGMGFYHRHWRWSFPVRRIRRKVAIELCRSVVGLVGSYDCVRRMIVSFLVDGRQRRPGTVKSPSPAVIHRPRPTTGGYKIYLDEIENSSESAL